MVSHAYNVATLAPGVHSLRFMNYSESNGWTGGDSRTLYTITDTRTGTVVVRPGDSMNGIGPAVDIRVATRAEAEEHWQCPLHSGWKVEEPAAPGPTMVHAETAYGATVVLSRGILCF